MKDASLFSVVGSVAFPKKRLILKSLGALAIASALNLQLSPVPAQGADLALLTTITNPTPARWDYFGAFVAAVGNDRVLIGAFNYGGDDSGAAYLYTANGVRLTTFYNPTPASLDGFGSSVAGVGSDRVLIGTPYDNSAGTTKAGAAYLFSTSGTLLTTFTNPAPQYQELFGMTVTAVGSDAVLIGAPYNNAGAVGSGAACLFSTNGALITTFTNPAPNYQGLVRPVAGGHRDRPGADCSTLQRPARGQCRGGVSVPHQRHVAHDLHQSHAGNR